MLRRDVSTSPAGSAFELEHTNPRADVLDGDVLDVEADVYAGGRLGEGLVVHLDRLDLRRQAGRRERHDVPGLEHAGLDAADGNCADAADLVHVLEREAERTACRGPQSGRAAGRP